MELGRYVLLACSMTLACAAPVASAPVRHASESAAPASDSHTPDSHTRDSHTPASHTPDSRATDEGIVATFFHGDEVDGLAPVDPERVRVFEGRPWIDATSPGTMVFLIDGGRSPMPPEWVERLRRDAASRGCDAIQIGFVQGATCDYFVVPDRIDGYCARCLVLPAR